jgi:hypothetical protein
MERQRVPVSAVLSSRVFRFDAFVSAGVAVAVDPESTVFLRFGASATSADF